MAIYSVFGYNKNKGEIYNKDYFNLQTKFNDT